jgi:type VI secretion system ImpC/EvpB family protein
MEPQLALAVPPAAEAAPPASLLAAVLDRPAGEEAEGGFSLERFLREPSPARALSLWLGDRAASLRAAPRLLAELLGRDIARIDEALTRQVNAILHHPDLQRLEASWRGLRFLVEQLPADADGDADRGMVEIKVLNISRKELVKDVEGASEFDQSQVFRKVYEEEYGMPGGEPYGALLGDYEFKNHPEDVSLLSKLSNVAAAAFAPFVAAAHPALLDLTSFTDLERPPDLPATFDRPAFLKWRALRRDPDARFVGLTLPRVLMRLPYRDGDGRAHGFRFREDLTAPDRGGYLWGNAAYAFGAVLVRTFAATGWLADLRGAPLGREGGLVEGLHAHSFGTDADGVVPKPLAEVALTDMLEKELGDQGFLPLCSRPGTGQAVFHGRPSIQQPQPYDDPVATANARLSAGLAQILCVSRFAHYLKVMARDRVGGSATAAELQAVLQKWLMKYVSANDGASPELRARFPLAEARVRVQEDLGRPGRLRCEMHLRPHFRPEQLVSTIKLFTSFSSWKGT